MRDRAYKITYWLIGRLSAINRWLDRHPIKVPVLKYKREEPPSEPQLRPDDAVRRFGIY